MSQLLFRVYLSLTSPFLLMGMIALAVCAPVQLGWKCAQKWVAQELDRL